MSLEEYKGVFVFAQQVDNVLDGVAFELLGKGKDLAKDLNTEVTAVLIGSGVKGLADQLAEYGADRVIVVDDPELKEYRTEPYAHALASVINEYKPEIMLVGATAIGRDLGPTVSARVKTGLTADCTSLEIGDFPLVAAPGKESEQKHNQLLMTRPAFGGNTIATIACPDNRPQMATVRPGVMQKIAPIAGAKANVVEFNPGFTPNNRYVVWCKSRVVLYNVCFCTADRSDLLHNTWTYSCHLRTVVRAGNCCDGVTTKCRTCH